jgi:predicted DNA-binding transcriptional regulator YafY
MRRIERLINLIAALLEAPRPMTAQEIHEQIAGYGQPGYESFRRAFERDKEALRALGIPLDVRPNDPWTGVADGYIIDKERYYLPDLDLEPDEVAALHIAAQAVLGAGGEAQTGLLKLSLDDPPSHWSSLHLAWVADFAAQKAVLTALYSALLERTPVEFSYRAGGSRRAAVRRVEAYGLVHSRGHWYVVGRDALKEDVRSFRVDRIVSGPSPLEGGSYRIPEGFDAGHHVRVEPWEIGSDAPCVATVRFDAPIRWWALQNMPGLRSVDGPDGSLEVDIPVANLDRFISWIIGFGESVEILAPQEARDRLIQLLAPFLEAGTV